MCSTSSTGSFWKGAMALGGCPRITLSSWRSESVHSGGGSSVKRSMKEGLRMSSGLWGWFSLSWKLESACVAVEARSVAIVVESDGA